MRVCWAICPALKAICIRSRKRCGACGRSRMNLGFAQRRTEELGQRLVAREAAVLQLSTSNEQLQAKVDELLTAKQQLELAMAMARSSVTAQEQVVASMLERFSATAPDPDLAAKNPDEGAVNQLRESQINQRGQGLKLVFAGFYMNPCRPSIKPIENPEQYGDAGGRPSCSNHALCAQTIWTNCAYSIGSRDAWRVSCQALLI
jgi:hypothetical protein